MKNSIKTLLALSALAALTSAASAATVAWGTPGNITGNSTFTSDISTVGTLDRAYNVGDSATNPTTISGVTFAAFSMPGTGFYGNSTTTQTVGQTTLALTGFTDWSQAGSGSNFGGSTLAPFASLSPEYQEMLKGGTFNFNAVPDSSVLTLNGLVAAQEYQIQIFSNDSQDLTFVPPSGLQRATLVTGGANSVTLASNTSSSPFGQYGGTGQWVIGSFIADGTSQVITFSAASNTATLNGFQLRTVPEPATWVLIALSGTFMMIFRRRRLA